jgi:histidyl-tRNA synthetase
VNNRKVLDGVLEAIGLGGDENAERRLTVLRAIDKLDKFGVEGVRQLLGPGRKDESGDFTKGAGLDEESREKLMLLFTHSSDRSADYFRAMSKNEVLPTDALLQGGKSELPLVIGNPSFLDTYEAQFPNAELFVEGLNELRQVSSIVRASGYGTQMIRITPSVVRGLEYYTGPVFEAELLAEIPNEKGEIVRFGSVGGGGRYDGLVSRFMGQPVPATGFSIGVSRLMTALKNLGKLGQDAVLPPVLVTVMDRDIDALGRYQRFTQELRSAGIRAEMFQGNPKNFGNQLKYADRRGCPVAIIQGGDERQQGVVQIKDLIEGKRASEAIEDNAAWREARVAQVTVSESELVAKVREMLDAQARDRDGAA